VDAKYSSPAFRSYLSVWFAGLTGKNSRSHFAVGEIFGQFEHFQIWWAACLIS